MKYLISSLCCILIFSTNVTADARKNLEDELRKIYEHSVVSLKTPDAANKLQFDAQGALAGSAVACPWSICGMLQVEKVVLAQGRLEIRGRRVILALRSSKSDVNVIPLATDRGIQIRVDLPNSPLDIPQVNKILSKVFQGGGLLERVGKYWKPKIDLGGPDSAHQIEVLRDSTPIAIVGELEGNRPVYLVNPGKIDPPKPIHTPDPEYSDSARRQRLEGTTIVMVVVDEKGFPEILQITKGLGEGLDLLALTAVSGWTFRPAMKNGEPVSVLIYVEVTFRVH
jgi:TonB family protein